MLASTLPIYSTDCVGFLVLKCLVSICLNLHFVFYSPSAFLFLFPILFWPFISPIFMLQTGFETLLYPIKSQMEVKYPNTNANHFKMFAVRIRMQQFL